LASTTKFNACISALLNRRQPPTTARCAAWIETHDEIEKAIGPTGGVDVRDVAAKAADNIARMARLSLWT
jgi:hypothetical protein